MKDLMYVSTRGGDEKVTASQAILQGIAANGGLFVPKSFPKAKAPLEELLAMDYQTLACQIFEAFLTDYTPEEIAHCVYSAYDKKFDTTAIAPLVSVDGVHFLELFHGPTLAFKDMALSILPYLMKTAAAKNKLDKKIIILVSTSGDTGKAALEGFADVEGTAILVLYPHGKVSEMQRLQMTTQEGDNTAVLGVHGNFDDCQSTMKGILTSPQVQAELEAHNAVFSSANSINFGRLLPQVVYYFYAYGQLVKAGAVKCGDPVNFTVPTGNFGNILAGYYAKQMGLPVGQLICASNMNHVLADFLTTGVYDRNRPFVTTSSPSMDILISSNLERLLAHLSGDFNATRAWMQQLTEKGTYTFPQPVEGFIGGYATEEESLDAMARMFRRGYTMDPHTAVAYTVYEKLKVGDATNIPNVIVSTASPFKFAPDVLKGIAPGKEGESQDPFALAQALSAASGLAVPEGVLKLKGKPERHRQCCQKEEAQGQVISFIKNTV